MAATIWNFVTGKKQTVERSRHGLHLLSQESVVIADHVRGNKKLGEGSYAKVYVGKYLGKDRAVKVFKEDLFSSDKVKEEFERLNSLKHPNIVRVYGMWEDPYKGRYSLAIVMELCDGSLHQFIEQSTYKGISSEQKLKILHDITCAMVYLHSQNVVHGDLRTPNVLVNKSNDVVTAKLTDFGRARLLKASANAHYTASPIDDDYLPPEVFNHDEYKNEPKNYARLTRQVDAFFFGPITIELTCGQFPKPGPKIEKKKGAVVKTFSEVERREKHLMMIKPGDRMYVDLIVEQCMTDNPADRASFEELQLIVEVFQKKYDKRPDKEMLEEKQREVEFLKSAMEADQVTLNYEVQLEDYGKECERFKEEAKQKSEQLTAAEESLRKKDEECRVLQDLHGKKMAEYGDLQQKHVGVEDDNTELQSSVKQSTQKCTELQKEKDELQSSLADAQRHISELETTVTNANRDSLNRANDRKDVQQRHKQEIEALKKAQQTVHGKLKEELQLLEEEKKKITMDLSAAECTNSQYEKALIDLRKDNTWSNTRIEQMETKVREAHVQAEGAKSAQEKMAEELLRMKKQFKEDRKQLEEELKVEVASKQAALSKKDTSQKKKERELKDSMEQLKLATTTMKTNLAEARSEYENAYVEMTQDWSAKNQHAKEAVDVLLEDKRKLEGKVKQAEKLAQQTRVAKERMSENLTEKEELLKETHKQLEEERKTLEVTRKEKDSLQSEKEQLTETAEKLQQEHMKDLLRRGEEIDRLKKSTASLNPQIATLTEEKDKIQAHRQEEQEAFSMQKYELEQQLAEAKEKVAVFEKSCKTLDEGLTEQKSCVDKLQHDVAALKKDNNRLEDENKSLTFKKKDVVTKDKHGELKKKLDESKKEARAKEDDLKRFQYELKTSQTKARNLEQQLNGANQAKLKLENDKESLKAEVQSKEKECSLLRSAEARWNKLKTDHEILQQKLRTAESELSQLKTEQSRTSSDMKGKDTDLRKKQDSIRLLKSDLKEVRDSLQASDVDIKKLKDEAKAHKEAFQFLERQLREEKLKNTSTKLQNQVKSLEGQLETSRAVAEQKQADNKTLEEELKTLEEELTKARLDAEDILDKHDKRIDEVECLKAARDELVKEKSDLASERDHFQKQNSGLNGERKSLQIERDNLVAEKGAVTSERDHLVGENSSLKVTEQSLRQERDSLVKDRDSLLQEKSAAMVEVETSFQQHEERKNEWETTNKDLGDKLESLELKLRLKEEEVTQLRATIERNETIEKDLGDRLESLGLKMHLKEEEVTQLRATIRHNETTEKDLGDRLESFELKLRLEVEEITQLRATIERNEAMVQDAQKEASQLRATIEQNEAMVQDAQGAASDLDKYRKRIQELRTQLKEAETEASQYKTTISELETKRSSQTTEENQQRQDIEGPLLVKINTLTKCLSQQETELQSSKGCISELERDIDASKAHSAELQSQLNHTGTELTSTHAELDTALVGLSNTQAELSNTQAELSNTKAELKKTQQQNESSSIRCQKLDQQCQELRQHILELKSAQNRLQKREEDLNQQVEVLKSVRDTAQRQAQDFDRGSRDLKLKLQTSQSDYENEKKKYERERGAAKILKNKNAKLTDSLSSCEKEVQALKEKGSHRREVMQQVVKSIQAQVAAVRSDLDQERSRQSDLKNSLELLLTLYEKRKLVILSRMHGKVEEAECAIKTSQYFVEENKGLVKDNDTLNKKLTNIRVEKEDLQFQCTTMQEEKAMLTEQLHDCRVQISKLEESNQSVTAEHRQALNDIQNLQTVISSKEEDLRQFAEQVASLESYLEKIKTQNKELQGQLEAERDRCTDLDKELGDMKESRESLLAEKRELTITLRAKVETVKAHDEKLERKAIQIFELKKESSCHLEQLQTAASALQTSESALSACRNELAGSVDESRARGMKVEQLFADLSESKTQVTSLTEQLGTVTDDLSSTTKKLEDVEQNRDELKESLKAETATLDVSECKLAEATSKNEASEAAIEELKSSWNACNERNKKTCKDLLQVEEQQRIQSEQLRKVKEEYSRMSIAKQQLEEKLQEKLIELAECTDVRSEAQKVENQCLKFKELAAKTEVQRKDLSADLSNKEQKLRQIVDAHETLKGKYKQMGKEKEEAESQCAQLSEALAQAQEGHTALSADLRTMTAKYMKFRNENVNLEDILADLQVKNQSLQQTKDFLHEKNGEMKRERLLLKQVSEDFDSLKLVHESVKHHLADLHDKHIAVEGENRHLRKLKRAERELKRDQETVRKSMQEIKEAKLRLQSREEAFDGVKSMVARSQNIIRKQERLQKQQSHIISKAPAFAVDTQKKIGLSIEENMQVYHQLFKQQWTAATEQIQLCMGNLPEQVMAAVTEHSTHLAQEKQEQLEQHMTDLITGMVQTVTKNHSSSLAHMTQQCQELEEQLREHQQATKKGTNEVLTLQRRQLDETRNLADSSERGSENIQLRMGNLPEQVMAAVREHSTHLAQEKQEQLEQHMTDLITGVVKTVTKNHSLSLAHMTQQCQELEEQLREHQQATKKGTNEVLTLQRRQLDETRNLADSSERGSENVCVVSPKVCCEIQSFQDAMIPYLLSLAYNHNFTDPTNTGPCTDISKLEAVCDLKALTVIDIGSLDPRCSSYLPSIHPYCTQTVIAVIKSIWRVYKALPYQMFSFSYLHASDKLYMCRLLLAVVPRMLTNTGETRLKSDILYTFARVPLNSALKLKVNMEALFSPKWHTGKDAQYLYQNYDFHVLPANMQCVADQLELDISRKLYSQLQIALSRQAAALATDKNQVEI